MAFEYANTALALFQTGYDMFTHSNELGWNEIDYFVQVRQIRGDMLNNIREEIADIYERAERKLETNLVVATLMLGIGFGFTVEGTFPDDVKSQWIVRYIYVFAAALSLICPFLAMLGFLTCRTRMSVWMSWFNDFVFALVNEEHHIAQGYLPCAPDMISYTRATTSALPVPWCPRWQFVRAMACCKRRPLPVKMSAEANHLQTVATLKMKKEFDKFYMHQVQRLHSCARLFLWAGSFATVVCAALLIGMYFQSQYPDTPRLWMAYSFTVAGGGLLGGLSWGYVACRSLVKPPEMTTPAVGSHSALLDFGRL